MNDALVHRVAERVIRLVPERAVILAAVSGGPDSLALIELLHIGQSWHGRQLELVHVDHGIAAESGAIANQVLAYACSRRLRSHVLRLELGPNCSETTARAARRRELRRLLATIPDSVIALGHHADDQVETVLLRLVRGSGPIGLAGMAGRRGPWIRPLLSENRGELAAFVLASGLTPWQDPANVDPRHLRSWLRTTALPMLSSRLPDLRERLIEAAGHATELRIGLNSLPEMLTSLDFRADESGISVAVEALSGYRSAAKRLVLAAIGRRLGVPLGRNRLARIEGLLASPMSGKSVRLAQGLEAELAFGRLLLRRPSAVGFEAAVLPESGLLSVGAHRLVVELESGSDRPIRRASVTQLRRGNYLVRPWRRGDRMRPVGGTGSRLVAVLLKEAQVAASERRGWPVIATASDDATIVWLPGICRSIELVPEPEEEALRVAWNIS